jgi:phosphoribosyl-ATP pyrophosphohydrolase/phosphoribosyl-AMP cyclohydrolase
MRTLTTENIGQVDWNKSGNGLVPAIIQDAGDRRVLMLGYMNRPALERTFQSGKVTFYSRSRNELWTKGETSGNFIQFQGAEIDCDNDTILVQARPSGPVCHEGTPTCFAEDPQNALPFIAQLQEIIKSRRGATAESSYTASLFEQGKARLCQKVGEEGVEVSLAGMKEDKDELLNESADLLFHLMALLEYNDLSIEDVSNVLKTRHQKA